MRPDGSNPCRHVKKFKETKRKRYLSEAELRALGEALDDLKAIVPLVDNPYVIVGGKAGDHLKDLQKPWRKIRASAGLEGVRIHDLRHTFGSAGVNDGMSLPIVGKLLGHTRPETTARYAHLANTPLRLAAERISDAIGGAILNGRHNGSDWSELSAAPRAAREDAGLSLGDVARKVAISEIDATQIEKGCDMTLGLLQRYANALGRKVEIRLSDASS